MHPNRSKCGPIGPFLVLDQQILYLNLGTFEMYQGWKNKMSHCSSFCFMEQNCAIRGKMHEFLWLLRIEKNRKNVRTMVACGACMILIAKNAPKAASQHSRVCIVEMHTRKLRHDDTSAKNIKTYLGYAYPRKLSQR